METLLLPDFRTYTHTRTHAYTRIHTHARTLTHTHTNTHTHTQAWLFISKLNKRNYKTKMIS